MSFLALEGLQKTYADGTQAVKGIDLDIDKGELIVLLGPSGCGKTTTLRMIAGLELATAGIIRMDGQDVTALRPSRRDVGMVFQFYALYPHLTVRENIGFPLRSAGVTAAETRSRVDAVAAQMDLGKLLSRYPKQLSGGDQQKVSLARAIVRRPAVYLMDEPLGTLDADQRLAMRELIRSVQLTSKVTTIYVTHDQEEAMSLADRIVVMEGGRIRQVGTPAEVYDQPADRFVATFVGSPGMNFIAGRVAERDKGPVFLTEQGQVPLPIASGSAAPARTTLHSGQATLGIRCEHVHEDPSGPIAGTVVAEEYLGNASNVHLDTVMGRLIMRAGSSWSSDAATLPVSTSVNGGDQPARAASTRGTGTELRLRLDAAQMSIFDGATEQRL
ncbi:MAG: ABC transporter ATP-binding protein [Myxococcales bacterium]